MDDPEAITIVPETAPEDEPSFMEVPVSSRTRGRFAVRKLVYQAWTRGEKHTLRETIDLLIEDWEG